MIQPPVGSEERITETVARQGAGRRAQRGGSTIHRKVLHAHTSGQVRFTVEQRAHRQAARSWRASGAGPIDRWTRRLSIGYHPTRQQDAASSRLQGRQPDPREPVDPHAGSAAVRGMHKRRARFARCRCCAVPARLASPAVASPRRSPVRTPWSGPPAAPVAHRPKRGRVVRLGGDGRRYVRRRMPLIEDRARPPQWCSMADASGALGLASQPMAVRNEPAMSGAWLTTLFWETLLSG